MPSPRGETVRAYAQPDAANTEGTLIPAANSAAPWAEAQADGTAAASGRQTCARSARRTGGHSRSVREHPVQSQGTPCPYTPSSMCKVLSRGELPRLQASAWAELATDNQKI